MKITVPIPHVSLNPNAWSHWRTRSKWQKVAKNHGHVGAIVAASKQGPMHAAGRIGMRVLWFGPTAKVFRMDDDNAWARLKSTRDGIARGLGIDDRVLKQVDLTFAKDAANPRVEITLEAINEA